MPDHDMIFTPRELEADCHPHRRHFHRRGPDMVFTPSEVAAANAPAVAPRPTIEEVDRRRPPATSPEQTDALANAGASRQSEATNLVGTANDTAGVVNAYRSMPSIKRPLSDRALGPLAAVAGASQAYNAFTSATRPGATEEDRVQGAYGVGIGTLGAAGGVATLAGMSRASGVLGIGAGALEAHQGWRNLHSDDPRTQDQGVQQAMHGTLAGASSAAGLVTNLTPVGSLANAGAATAAPVLAAGAAGVAAGTTLQQRAEAVSLEQGRYSEQRAGRGINGAAETHHISASEAAARTGVEDAQLTRDALAPYVGNTVASGFGAFAGGVNAMGAGIYNTFTNLW